LVPKEEGPLKNVVLEALDLDLATAAVVF